MPIAPLQLRLPATSANLGPGFDALGLAMALYLTIVAEPAPSFHIAATGRNADLCANADTSLILTTYRDLLGPAAPPLALILHNDIPLGMGCGSSAAALLAGVLLANHFGQLGWSLQQVLEEACRREGHPDNVAACFHGGMTSSAIIANQVITATCGQTSTGTSSSPFPPPASPERRPRRPAPSCPHLHPRRRRRQRPVHGPARLRLRPRPPRSPPPRHARPPPPALPHGGLHAAPTPAPHDRRPQHPRRRPQRSRPSVLLIAAPGTDLPTLTARIRHLTADPTVEVVATTISGGYTDGL